MTRLGSQEWIKQAFKAFQRGGIENVRVEKLAADLNVTKGSFYWHFANRQSLLHDMLDYWEEIGTSRIIEQVQAVGPDARARLYALCELTFSNAQLEEAQLDAKLRAWASTDSTAAETLIRVDKRRLAYVRSLLDDLSVPNAKHRAELIYRALIGEYT